MFDWVVKNVGFLKHVPLLPHVFDTGLKVTSLFYNKNLIDYLDEIEREVRSWPNTAVQPHKFGGIQFNAPRRELGHLHGNGLLDIPMSREQKFWLMQRYPVQEHHVFKDSGWISFKIKTEQDKEMAITLLRYTYANRQYDEKIIT